MRAIALHSLPSAPRCPSPGRANPSAWTLSLPVRHALFGCPARPRSRAHNHWSASCGASPGDVSRARRHLLLLRRSLLQGRFYASARSRQPSQPVGRRGQPRCTSAGLALGVVTVRCRRRCLVAVSLCSTTPAWGHCLPGWRRAPQCAVAGARTVTSASNVNASLERSGGAEISWRQPRRAVRLSQSRLSVSRGQSSSTGCSHACLDAIARCCPSDLLDAYSQVRLPAFAHTDLLSGAGSVRPGVSCRQTVPLQRLPRQ